MADVTNRIPGSRTEVVDVDDTGSLRAIPERDGPARRPRNRHSEQDLGGSPEADAADRRRDRDRRRPGTPAHEEGRHRTILISGRDVVIDSSGAVNVKASRDVVLKGKKILEN